MFEEQLELNGKIIRKSKGTRRLVPHENARFGLGCRRVSLMEFSSCGSLRTTRSFKWVVGLIAVPIYEVALNYHEHDSLRNVIRLYCDNSNQPVIIVVYPARGCNLNVGICNSNYHVPEPFAGQPRKLPSQRLSLLYYLLVNYGNCAFKDAWN